MKKTGISTRRKNYKTKLKQLGNLKNELKQAKQSYEEEAEKLRKLYEEKMKKLEGQIVTAYQEVSCAKLLYCHPYIRELELWIEPMSLVHLCIDYTGEKFCIKCEEMYFGDECFHELSQIHDLSYTLKGNLIPQKGCYWYDGDFHSHDGYYMCYRIESEEDRDLFSYWDRKTDGWLDRNGMCVRSSNNVINSSSDDDNSDSYHEFPFYYSIYLYNHDVIESGRRIVLSKELPPYDTYKFDIES